MTKFDVGTAKVEYRQLHPESHTFNSEEGGPERRGIYIKSVNY